MLSNWMQPIRLTSNVADCSTADLQPQFNLQAEMNRYVYLVQFDAANEFMIKYRAADYGLSRSSDLIQFKLLETGQESSEQLNDARSRQSQVFVVACQASTD